MKQAGQLWNKTMHNRMLEFGFTQHPSNPCIYYWKNEDGLILTGVHVDDYIITGNNDAGIAKFKGKLRERWVISDLGKTKFCLGITITWDLETKSISFLQTALIDRILDTFNMKDCYSISTPMDPGLTLSCKPECLLSPDECLANTKLPYPSLVGCLMYLAIGTHPDLALLIQVLSQFLDCYTEVHWKAALQVVHYLKGTCDLSLNLGGSKAGHLIGFCDASYANCVDTRCSTGGYCFSLGSCMVTWAARKQKTVAQSTMDAEYIALHESAKEAIWLRGLLEELELCQKDPTPVLADNQGVNILAEDPTFHSCAKHIDVKFHTTHEYISDGHIAISYIPSTDNVANIMMKPLGPKPFACL